MLSAPWWQLRYEGKPMCSLERQPDLLLGGEDAAGGSVVSAAAFGGGELLVGLRGVAGGVLVQQVQPLPPGDVP
jgi:hypothetical protein